MRKILWIAPNLNHYKTRFLKKLHGSFFDISVLAGAEQHSLGHKTDNQDGVGLEITRLPASKSNFQRHPAVYLSLWRTIRKNRPDIILMPCEKKHLLLIIYISILRQIYPFMFVTYTHPLMRSKGLKFKRFNRTLTIGMFSLYDRIIFYTQHAMHKAIDNDLLPKDKAYYANNTLDTDAIREVYEYKPPPMQPKILYIGRLIPSKRIDLLLHYYAAIKKLIPSLELVIIGDGPESDLILKEQKKDNSIKFEGAIVDESVIAGLMDEIQIVFLPGLSGLSIVHAFSYGKPFVTIEHENHGPEIAYLKDGHNGLILEDNIEENVHRLVNLLRNTQLLKTLSSNAYETSTKLSIEQWCIQINTALVEQ